MKVNANAEVKCVEQLITGQCAPVIYISVMLTLTLISCSNIHTLIVLLICLIVLLIIWYFNWHDFDIITDIHDQNVMYCS